MDLEHIIRDLLDPLGDGPAVLGLELEGLEDEEVEGALDEISGCLDYLHYASYCR